MRVAVMQPYFYPYAGYYRLFAAVDAFVLFDCVQFPRRGRVHRAELPAPDGGTAWLTLPLARQARDTLIRDLEFAPDARAVLDRRLQRFGFIENGTGELAARVRAHLDSPLGSVVDFLADGLEAVTGGLGIGCATMRSSALRIDPALRGQDRVIAIVRAVGGDTYVNSPGGRALYDPSAFARNGISLRFLSAYRGESGSVLTRLMQQDAAQIRRDIVDSCETSE